MIELELLAPAANKDIAIEAILHGADAVYIGATSHGARKSAGNSIEDIKDVVTFAHQYRAKVYVTVNTIIYDHELSLVETLIWDLYRVGVDAIIVQDMGVLRLNLPPIQLHASTQCDTRSVEKALFLQEIGFSQIVLARELNISEINKICDAVNVPVECFVHGALCVSYSGRCRASQVKTGRSANRGECSQLCRLPYSLIDSNGKTIVSNRHLLSLKDLNLSENIDSLIKAGVRSFKIEGRLKDAGYVKNVTAYYRNIIDKFIANNNEYCRSSCGISEITFAPKLEKSFNRGFTPYFFSNRKQTNQASLITPKSMGEKINSLSELHNGDGISFINSRGEYEGVRLNKIENGRLVGAKPFTLPKGAEIRRTYDIEWDKTLGKQTAKRVVWIDIEIDEVGITAIDERGNKIRIALEVEKYHADKKMDPEKIFAKLGSTIYRLKNFTNKLCEQTFIPASQLNEMKRAMICALDKANDANYPIQLKLKENKEYNYSINSLDSESNVSNRLAREFYESHGSIVKENAVEVATPNDPEIAVMRTRYCIRRELGMCKKEIDGKKIDLYREPFYLKSANNEMRIEFDCKECGMILYSQYRK